MLTFLFDRVLYHMEWLSKLESEMSVSQCGQTRRWTYGHGEIGRGWRNWLNSGEREDLPYP